MAHPWEKQGGMDYIPRLRALATHAWRSYRRTSVLPVFSLTLTALALVPPAAFGAASVTVAWDPALDEGIAGYRVHAGTASREYRRVFSVTEGTAVTISNLVRGVTNYFAITAFDAFGQESGFSDEISFKPAFVLPPAGNLSVALATGTTNLTLNWGESTNSAVAGYRVYFGTGAGDFTGMIDTGIQTTTLLPPPGSASPAVVTIVAYDHNGAETDYSRSIALHPGSPRVKMRVAANQSALVQGTGQPGRSYLIEATGDFKVWQPVATATAGSDGTFEIADAGAGKSRNRFYRLQETTAQAPLPRTQVQSSAQGPRQIIGTGVAGRTYEIQATTDFIHWTVLGHAVAGSDGAFALPDPAATGTAMRFYRLRDTTSSPAVPQVGIRKRAGGQRFLHGKGDPGQTYEIQATRNLRDWTPLARLVVGDDGTFELPASSVGNPSALFYRLRLVQ